MTRLQSQHRRQSPLPEAFALSTLASNNRPVRTEAQRRQHTRDACKVARLISRGELELALERPTDIETALSEAVESAKEPDLDTFLKVFRLQFELAKCVLPPEATK